MRSIIPILLVAVASCSGGGNGDDGGDDDGGVVEPIAHLDIVKDASTEVRGTFGREGGELRMTSAAGDVVVTIPPNAVADPTEFAVANASTELAGLSQLVMLEPDGASFFVPIDVRFLGKGSDTWAFHVNGDGNDPYAMTPRTDGQDLVVEVFHFSGAGAGKARLPVFAPLSSEGRSREALRHEPQPMTSARAVQLLDPWLDEVEFLVEMAVGNPAQLERAIIAFASISRVIQELGLLPEPLGARNAVLEERLIRVLQLRLRDMNIAAVETDSLRPYSPLGPLYAAYEIVALNGVGSGITIPEVSAMTSVRVIIDNVAIGDDPDSGVATLSARVGYQIGTGAIQRFPPLDVNVHLNRAHFGLGDNGTVDRELVPDEDGNIETSYRPDELTYNVEVNATIPTAFTVPGTEIVSFIAPLDLKSAHPIVNHPAGGPTHIELGVHRNGTNDPFTNSITLPDDVEATLQGTVRKGTVRLRDAAVSVELIGAGVLSGTSATTGSDGTFAVGYTPVPAAVFSTVTVRASHTTLQGQTVTDDAQITVTGEVRATMSVLRHRQNYPTAMVNTHSGPVTCPSGQQIQDGFAQPADADVPLVMNAGPSSVRVLRPNPATYEVRVTADVDGRLTTNCPTGEVFTNNGRLVISHTLLVTPITNGRVFLNGGMFGTNIFGVVRFGNISELDNNTAPLTQVSAGQAIPMTAGVPFAVVVATQIINSVPGMDLALTDELTIRATFGPP